MFISSTPDFILKVKSFEKFKMHESDKDKSRPNQVWEKKLCVCIHHHNGGLWACKAASTSNISVINHFLTVNSSRLYCDAVLFGARSWPLRLSKLSVIPHFHQPMTRINNSFRSSHSQAHSSYLTELLHYSVLAFCQLINVLMCRVAGKRINIKPTSAQKINHPSHLKYSSNVISFS